MSRRRPASALLLTVVLAAASRPALPWSAEGHRTVLCLALSAGDTAAPTWMGEPGWRQRALDASVAPDRLRAVAAPALRHLTAPDHYLDVDRLPDHGLTLGTMPRLRHAFAAALGGARPPLPPPDPEHDPEDVSRWPGFLAQAMDERFAALTAALHESRRLPPGPLREQSRSEVVTHLGWLAHLVADAAQPLHTTRHHHGWAAANPRGYSTDPRLHALVDQLPDRPGLACADLAPRLGPPPPSRDDPWPALLALLQESFDMVEPLYALELSGGLQAGGGAEFAAARLLAAGRLLARLLSQAAAAPEVPAGGAQAEAPAEKGPAAEATPPPARK